MLERAKLQGASLYHASVWRTQFRGRYEPALKGASLIDLDYTPLDGNVVEEIENASLDGVDTDAARYRIVKSLAVLDRWAKSQDEDARTTDFWKQAESRSAPEASYMQKLAGELRRIACRRNAKYARGKLFYSGAPYAAAGIVRLRLSEIGSPHKTELAKVLLAPEENDCPGAVGLDEEMIATLKEVVAAAEPAKKTTPTTAQNPTDAVKE